MTARAGSSSSSAAVGAGGRDSRLGPLIITLFALYARGEQDWLSVASVIRLMADLGVEGQAVRSAVSRLKRRGVLHGERRGGVAGYAVSEGTLEVLAEGDVRIFERSRAAADDGWLVVVFSVPESERDRRHALRTALTRLGFGTAAPGVWVAPGILAEETRRTLRRLELTPYVDVFTGDHFAFGDLSAKVRAWWDLDELAALYTDFLARYRPVSERAATGAVPPREAFGIHLPMLTEWRRLPYRDPGLPLSLLPPGWEGETAGALFADLDRTLREPAREHALAVIHSRA
ncbi:PaaX family transcriptional regulator C-terminal domain-containing protein [Streptomyces sp. NPDC006654]|uniref:PaaX family transcriptional regulator n=1 Tax=Streptomyces sp. NPDC006654 TaxID=3156897 RepID=UPI0033E19B78